MYLGTLIFLLSAARFTTGYVRLVGQDPAPSKCVLLSTSRVVRKDMVYWVLSQEGDNGLSSMMSVNLGGHLDTTLRGWSATSAARVRLVISRLVLIFALPLDFHCRVRVVRSMYLSAALHGVESSLLALDSLRKLRSSICRVVWSRRQPLASIGAVLSLFGWATRCDPDFCVVWFRFRLFRRDPLTLAWFRPGLPMLSNLAGPIQHVKAAILDAWRNKVAADLCGREGFRDGPCWMYMALCTSSTLLMFGIGIRVGFRVLWLGVCGLGFSLGKVRGQPVPCRFCVVVGILFFLNYIVFLLLNRDGVGGTALDPMVWSAGALPKRRRIVHAVRNLAMLPGPPDLWLGDWVAGLAVTIGADDVAQWPYTPGLLIKWVSFPGSLHWPVG